MNYVEPQITDHGDLVELTAAAGILLTEDGAGKAVTVQVDPIIGLTLQILPEEPPQPVLITGVPVLPGRPFSLQTALQCLTRRVKRVVWPVHTAREAYMIRTYRSFAGLLATVATVAALMVVPATSSADKTLQISVPSLGAIVCPILGNGTGSVNGVLIALNLRICPS
jgi:hypothetical protein